jgi:hypothetical protein
MPKIHLNSSCVPVSLPLPSLKAGESGAQEQSPQAHQAHDLPQAQPSIPNASAPSRIDGTPFAENPNRGLISSLLGGNHQTRSIIPEKWRQPIDKADLAELSKALPEGTPMTIAISNVQAIPAKNVDPEKLKAFRDAGRLTGYIMYDGKVPFKRAEPPSGPAVKLVSKGFTTPDLPVKTSVLESGGVTELRLTNTEKLSSFGSTVVEKGQ